MLKKGIEKMATREKNTWILMLFICSGLVLGGLLGQLASDIEWLRWLSYGQQFGLQSPLIVDLNVVQITFAFILNINIASIIGLAIAIFVYRKI